MHLSVMLLYAGTFFTLDHFDTLIRRCCLCTDFCDYKSVFCYQGWWPAERNFQEQFNNHKKLTEIRHYGRDNTILLEYARDKFKKHPALKRYIVERILGYSKIAKKNVCSTSMESFKLEL